MPPELSKRVTLHSGIAKFCVYWAPVAAIFMASRAVLLLIALLTTYEAPGLQNGSLSLTTLCRFDCNWYLGIAEHGYSTAENPNQPGATNFAFYPLFPLLARSVAWLLGSNILGAGFAIANICFFAALVFVYKYLMLIGADRRTALLTLAFTSIIPQSLAFSVPYSESLFLLLLVVAMYYTRREQFLLAGLAAALLSATRANGIFFVLFALVWVWRRYGARPFVKPWSSPQAFVPIVLAPLGLFLFWAYCFLSTGDAFAHPSSELHGWGWRFMAPWNNVPLALRIGGMQGFAILISLGVLMGCVLLARDKLYEELALCAGCLLLVWCGGATGSVFRYWLFAFPIWYVFARRLEPRPIATMVTFSMLSMVNGAFTCAWLFQKVFAI